MTLTDCPSTGVSTTLISSHQMACKYEFSFSIRINVGTTIEYPARALRFILMSPATRQRISFTNSNIYNTNFEFGFSFGLDLGFVRVTVWG